jgi:putative hydrolase of the HAD superfamily
LTAEDVEMTKRLPKAILLDLDDTILAFSESGDLCWRQTCHTFAPRIPGLTAKELFEGIKKSRFQYWQDRERHRKGRLNLRSARREVVRDAFQQIKIDAPALADEIADAYSTERDEAIWVLPGAIEALGYLQGQGVQLGLITNGDGAGQRWKIERFGLEQFFDLIVIEGEFGVGKPDEEVYLYAVGELGVGAEETWMVGDNLEWDVQAPQGLGLFAVWVDSRGKGLPRKSSVQPNRIVRSLSELVEREWRSGGT